MLYARDLKKKQVVVIDGNYYIVRHLETKSPSARGAQTLYKVRFTALSGDHKLDKTLTGDDVLTEVSLVRRLVSLLYKEGNECVFMDSEDYTQYLINTDTIREELQYIHDGQDGLMALLVEEQLVALELPASVSLSVVETAPAIKGASAAARTKPAKLTTGLEIQVPEYLSEGEMVKVNTETGKFISRA